MKKIISSIFTTIAAMSLFVNISVYLYLSMSGMHAVFLPGEFITGQVFLLIFCAIIIFVTNYEYPAEKEGDHV